VSVNAEEDALVANSNILALRWTLSGMSLVISGKFETQDRAHDLEIELDIGDWLSIAERDQRHQRRLA